MWFERIGEIFYLGLKSLMRNKLRSFLTMLGIIFGVGPVITMPPVGAEFLGLLGLDLAHVSGAGEGWSQAR